jgi:hypothetical protein
MPVEVFEATVDAIDPPTQAIEPLVYAIEPLVYAIEPPVQAIEPLVHAIEPPVHAIEPPVQAIETNGVSVQHRFHFVLADLQAVQALVDSIESLFGHAFLRSPDTLATSQPRRSESTTIHRPAAVLEEQSACREERRTDSVAAAGLLQELHSRLGPTSQDLRRRGRVEPTLTLVLWHSSSGRW